MHLFILLLKKYTNIQKRVFILSCHHHKSRILRDVALIPVKIMLTGCKGCSLSNHALLLLGMRIKFLHKRARDPA